MQTYPQNETHRQTALPDRQIDRHTYIHTDRPTDTHAGRQTDMYRHAETADVEVDMRHSDVTQLT